MYAIQHLAMAADRRSCCIQLLLAAMMSLGAGCSSTPATDARDPWEPVNRQVFHFNERVDHAVLAPLARTYRQVTPAPLRRGISNLFANLGDLGGTVNAGLQGRAGGAARNGSRFLINTTLGVLGLFDVASELGIDRYKTDFGHTLAVWGAQQGPYLVLPLLGPRTARSGVGNGVGIMLRQGWQGDSVVLPAMEALDSRSALLDAEDLISGDRYLFVREAYLQYRSALEDSPGEYDAFADSDVEYDWGE